MMVGNMVNSVVNKFMVDRDGINDMVCNGSLWLMVDIDHDGESWFIVVVNDMING